jgi:hypothetical protein
MICRACRTFVQRYTIYVVYLCVLSKTLHHKNISQYTLTKLKSPLVLIYPNPRARYMVDSSYSLLNDDISNSYYTSRMNA